MISNQETSLSHAYTFGCLGTVADLLHVLVTVGTLFDSECPNTSILQFNYIDMKKISLALLFVTISTVAFSQSFSFGPKAGVNISNYTGGNIESDSRIGFHLGGLLNFGIGNNFSIQPEVLFSSQGAKVTDAGSKKDWKTTYVAVPVMFKLRTNGGFYIELGPQASFKTGEDIPNQTIDSFAKNLDLAVGGGIGYQAGFGLGIGARYLAGVSKVGNFSGNNIDPDFKNSVIQVSLFYAIPAKRN